MHTYTAEDFDIELDELDSDAASSSQSKAKAGAGSGSDTAGGTTTTVKRRRRTTKKEQAILEALFEEVRPSSFPASLLSIMLMRLRHDMTVPHPVDRGTPARVHPD